MKRKSPAVFEASRKETITITVTPISVGAFVAAARNGAPLIDQSPTKKHFEFIFRIAEPVGSVEMVKIAGQFMGKEKDAARYEIEVSDDQGSGFTVLAIEKPAGFGFAERSRNMRFEVV